MHKKMWLLSFMFAIMLVLAACAGSGDTNEEANGEGDENGGENNRDEGEGEGGDMTISVGSDAVTLSAHGENDVPSSNVQKNIYETLTELDEDQEPQPALAEDWEKVDDTTWDFYLQEGIEFHDGEELDAEAVKMNFERLLDEDIGSPRAFALEAVEDIEVKDDYTVRLNLENPYGPLLAHLAHPGTAIMSPDIIEEDYDQMDEGEDVDSYINEHPVGTGPFEYEEWIQGEEVELSRNDDYWGDNAKLDSISFKVVDEQSTRLADLESGDADVADDIGPDNVSRVEGLPEADVLTEDSVSLDYISFNTQKEPFDDEKVRQAVSMAIDKEEILSGVYDDTGIPAEGPLAPPVFGYDDSVEGLEYDPEKAEELLEEAGYEDGFETTIWTNDSEERVDMAVAAQSHLSEIGVDVEVEELEWSAYLERTANGEHDMFILGWSTGTGDADYGLYPLFHSSQHGDPGNRAFLEDDDVDELLEDARRETDEDKRQELYTEAQEELVDVAPMLYIHHQEYLLGVDDTVHDFDIDARGYYEFEEAYIE